MAPGRDRISRPVQPASRRGGIRLGYGAQPSRQGWFSDPAGAGEGDDAVGRREILQTPNGGRSPDRARSQCWEVVRRRLRPCLLQADGRLRHVATPDCPVAKQAIAAAGIGFQQVPVGTERLAHGRGVNVKRALHDDGAGPDAVDQLVLGDELAGRLRQNLDDFEGATADRHRRSEHPKLAAREVDLAIARRENGSNALSGHATHIPVRVAKLPMGNVLRTEATDETEGFMKVLVGAEDDRIVGFAMIGSEAGEVMAAIQTAMLAELPYTKLRDAVFAHLTVAEGLGPLFGNVPASAV